MKTLKHSYYLKGNTINKHRPYDEASYFYANRRGGKWFIMRDGKKIQEIIFDDINEIADELNMANSAIESRICHN